jgi:hypothetical protein
VILGDDSLGIEGFEDIEYSGEGGIGCEYRCAGRGLVPDVNDGCVGGSVSVEKGFNGRAGRFDVDDLELALGVPDIR